MHERPNILFVTADQLRRDALGCYGNPVVQTPSIDAIAAGGVRFEQMYAAYPVCAPNRASIVTGRYPTVHRLRANGMRLPKSETTVMQVLRAAGYQTLAAGKMHFGPQWRFPAGGRPIIDPDPATAYDPQPDPGEFPWYGFDDVCLTEDHRTGPYGRYLAGHGYDVWDELHSASFPQHATVRSAFPEEHHQTTWITDRAVEYLRRRDTGRPFFLWVSYVHPHHPFNPPAPYDTMYRPQDMPLPVWREGEHEDWPQAYRRKYTARGGGHEAIGMQDLEAVDWQRIKAFYYGMITQIDRNVGRLLGELEAAGLAGNTLVVFASDHGENLGDHHLLFKGTTYDCVTGVPFLLSGPGIRRGGGVAGLVSSIDVMPTLLDLVSVSQPAPSPVQGRSLAPLIHGTGDVGRDALLIENVGPVRTVRTADTLLTWHGRGRRGELYDTKADPDCLHNLWAAPAAAGRRSDLLDLLLELMTENVDPLPPKEGPW